MNSAIANARLTRRGLLAVGTGALAAIALASCTTPPRYVTPAGAAVRQAELARGGTGRVTSVDLLASPTQVDLAGTTANTWSFGSVPAPTIRLTAGDTLRATVRNRLPADTSVHWHGLALRNDMTASPAQPRHRSEPGRTSATSSSPRNPAPTGSTRTSARSWTAACTGPSSSTTPTNPWPTTTNGWSSSTTGSTG